MATAELSDGARRHREAATRRSREAFASVADIGEIPAVVDAVRREECRLDLLKFLQTYFPNSTGLSPFSDDHERVVARIQQCILAGGKFTNAVYRGFAKTTISQNAAIWAVLYGHRRYVVVFGADQGAADRNVLAIKMELAENELLFEDFPEVCHAVLALEGKAQRCASQTHNGELTHIAWTAETIRLPFIAGSVAGGAILSSRGLTAATRGLVVKMPDGTNQRPDFVIVDDPQTDESASTALQVGKRLDLLKRSILKMAGHKKQMACVINATVIAADDFVEQLLDPRRNPSWQGERIKMVRHWADAHDTLWMDQYAGIRNNFDRDDPDDQRRAQRDANAFYVDNRAAMDAGCVVSWDHCFDPETEISSIQHAYNLLIDDGPDIFATECQNEPPIAKFNQGRLTAKEICERLNGFTRHAFPRECEQVTAFIDVQDQLLYYSVVAWGAGFTGYVIDYGTYPDQRRRYFRLTEAQNTLERSFPGDTKEGRWFKGLEQLANQLCGRKYARADGVQMPMGRVLVDANYGISTKAVKRFCLVSPWAPILLATHGRGVTAAQSGIHEWQKKQGEQRGHNWLIRPDQEAKGLRHGIYDTNYWKSFVHTRLRGTPHTLGSLSLWGDDARVHEMFADHLTAEYPEKVSGRGREIDQWMPIPSEPDNHWLDCLVGCAVGAAMLGVSLNENRTPGDGRRKVTIPQHMRRA